MDDINTPSASDAAPLWGQPLADAVENVGAAGAIVDHEPMDLDLAAPEPVPSPPAPAPVYTEAEKLSRMAEIDKQVEEMERTGKREPLPWEVSESAESEESVETIELKGYQVLDASETEPDSLRRLQDDVFLDVKFTEKLTNYPSRLRAISSRYSRRIKALGFRSLSSFLAEHKGLRLSVLPKSRALIIWTDGYYIEAGMGRDAMLKKFELFIKGDGEI